MPDAAPPPLPLESDESNESSEGVDLTQVRRALAMTPAQRLDALEAAVRSIRELMRGRKLD